MKRIFTNSLAMTTTAAAALIAGMASPAVAQNNQAAESAEDSDVIIVTARKREESLQNVPLSITAISADTIQKQGVSNIRDIVNLTPGLSLSEFGAGTLNLPVVRGQTNLTAGAFAESNVAVFYNGVYLQNINLVDATFLDIERVEVVKGPVSALYGRNAYAGVINYVTKRPSDTFTGNASVIGGTRGRRALQASVSGPLAGPALKASLAGRYDASDGSWQDPVTGVRFNGFDKYAVQAAVEAEPIEQLNLLATVFYAKDTFDQPARFFLGQGNCGAATGAFQTSICGKIPDWNSNTVIRSAKPSFSLYGNKRETLLGTFEAKLQLGKLELKSISALTDTSYEQRRDQDGTGIGFAYNLIGAPAGTVNLSTYSIGTSFDKSISQELRATLDVSDQLTLTLGGFYNKYDANQSLALAIDNSAVPAGRTVIVPFPIGFVDSNGNAPVAQRTRLDDKEVSGFGMIDLRVTPQFSISIEGRRSKQTKRQNALSGLLTGAFVDTDGPNGIGGSWSFWSYRASANYQITPDTLVYISEARGNKAGGFNVGAANPVDLQYNPERNTTFETGLKTKLFNGRAVFDIAAFYSDLSDLQLNFIAANGLTAVIKNAGAAKAYGFEASLSGQIADGVQLGIGAAYANPTFKQSSFLNSGAATTQCRNIPACLPRVGVVPGTAVTAVDLGGLSLPRQSDWQFNALLDIRQGLTSQWDWTARASYRYESKQYATTPPVNNGFAGAKHFLNLRAGVANDTFTIEAFVDNVLNDATPLNYGSGLNASNFQSPIAIVYGEKRKFGIAASFQF